MSGDDETPHFRCNYWRLHQYGSPLRKTPASESRVPWRLVGPLV